MKRLATVCAVAAIACGVLLSAQQLPSEPRRQFGAGVTGAFEGWFVNANGSRSFLAGYLNRNTTQVLDVPVGPNNRIEPGGPDMGQPTHFLPGRRYGMFVVPVPKDFTADQRLTWTIVANGQATSIPLRLHPDYVVNPFNEIAVNNTPPVLQFAQGGSSIQGPLASMATALAKTAMVSMPLALTLWASTTRSTRAIRTRRSAIHRRQSASCGRSSEAPARSPSRSRPRRSRNCPAEQRRSTASRRRRRPSASRATTCCTSRRWTIPARAAADFSAAGPRRCSRSR